MRAIELFITKLRHCLFPSGVSRSLQQGYTGVLQLVTLGRGLPRSINQEPSVRIDPEYRFIPNVYEPAVCAWIKQRLRPGDVVFDVGAHLGVYSMLAARWVSPGGVIHAFEPNPETVLGLQKNLQLNQMQNVVKVVPAAAGTRTERSSMLVLGLNVQNTLCAHADQLPGAQTVEVEVTALDDYCRELGVTPRLVKIDTEGWELHALRGAESLLAKREVDFVVEMHPYAWTNAGYTRSDFEEFLTRHQLCLEPLTGQADVFAEYGDACVSHLS